jgi:hypothetical protein
MTTVPISTNWGFQRGLGKPIYEQAGKTPIENILPSMMRRRGVSQNVRQMEDVVRTNASVSNTFANTFANTFDDASYNDKTRQIYRQDDLKCPDVSSHLSDCPVCSNLHTKEKLLYIFLGAIIVIIFFMIKKSI